MAMGFIKGMISLIGAGILLYLIISGGLVGLSLGGGMQTIIIIGIVLFVLWIIFKK